MRTARLLRGLSIVSLLFCAADDFGQTPPPSAVPLITEVTPPSLAPAPTSTQIVQFSLTIVGANFPSNPVVKLTVPQGPSIYAASASVNATGTQIVANFNTTLPRPAVYWVTVANAVNNPTRVSNIFDLPVTPPANTIAVSQTSTGFLSGLPEAVAVGDLNGDGIPDIAVVSQNTNTLSILMGVPGGLFNAGASYPTGNLPSGIVAADFNGDGILDLAFTNANDKTVSILLGNGDGTFRPGTTISDPGVYPTHLVGADFNGDGALDLAVINVCGPGTGTCSPQAGLGSPGSVTLLLGNGDGTFTVSANSPATGVFPSAIAAADLNGDGAIDLVIANQISNTLTLLMGNGNGTFTAAADVPTKSGPSAIAIADFNNDGKLDLAVANSSDKSVSVFLNQNCGMPASSCTFTANYGVSTGNNPIAVSAADMNADGYVDLVILNGSDNTVTVIPNNEAAFAPFIPIYPVTFSTNGGPNALGLAIADFNGDGRLDMVTLNQSGSYSLLLQTSVPQVVLTSSNTSPPYGLAVTFTANVNPSIGVQPTGTVTLLDGTFSLGTVWLSGYQANFQISTLNTGSHQITARYNGDANFLSTTSPAVTETVSQAQTTLTLGSNVNTVAYGQPFTLSATAQAQTSGTPTGTVSFFDTSDSAFLPTATLVNGVAQLTLSNLSPGAHVITATYNGDFNFTGSTSPTYQENITQAATTLTLTGSPSQAQFGQSVTLTAALQFNGSGAPTGTVTFLDGSTSLGTVNVSNNAASLSSSTLAVGSHVITAQYNGDSNFQASSGTMSELVSTDATTTTITSGTNPSSYGQAVTYTVSTSFVLSNLGTPAGLVTLYDGSTVLASAYLSKGSAQFTVSSAIAGTHSITAQYAGTSNYAASTSAALTQTVNPCATTLSVSASPNPSSVGQSVALQGTLQSTYGLVSTGGTITFYNNGTQLGSVVIQTNNINQQSGGIQIAFVTANTAILPVGSQAITAKYSGDSNLQASTGNMTQTVNPAPTTTTLTANPGAPTYGQNVTFTATLSPTYGNTPTGTVTFSMNGTTLGTASVSNNAAVFSTSTLSPGGHVIDAQYSGDANDASSANLVSLTVAPPPTTTVLTSSVNPSFFNQSVVIAATPQSSVSGTPTGTMTFYDNLTMIGSSALVSGSAQFSISSLYVGTHSFTATYSGDFNFAGSTSAALSQVVNLGPTATTVTSLDNPMTTPYYVRFLVTATATYGGTPSGTVTLYDGSAVIGSGTLTSNPNGNTVQINVSGLTAGSHSITAKYSGSVSFGASTSTVLTQVMNLPATSTSLSTPTTPVAYGQSVTLTASLVPGTQPTGSPLPSGTVTFFDGTTSLGNGTVANNSAQINVSLAVGSHTLTAKYNGDSNYTGSTSLPITEAVNQASTTATVASSANPAPFGQSVTFTASVVPAYGGSATGTIAFLDGANSLGSATLSNNNAQLTISNLAAGSHSITAKYNGDANFTGSTSSAVTETINAAATTTAVISSLNPASYGQSVTLSASIQPPSGVSATGTVTFFDGSTSLGTATISSNAAQLSLSLAAGTHSITAVYSGNSNLAGSTSSAVSEVVNSATTATSISSSANPASVGQVVTFTVSVQPAFGGTASGSVSFSDGATLLGTISLTNNSGQLSVSTLGAGSHSITAAYNGDASTNGSTSSVLSQTINPAATTTTFTVSPNPSVFNQWISFVVTVAPVTGGTPSGTVTLMDGTNTLSTATLSAGVGRISYSGLVPGTHSVTAAYSGDANFTASTSAAQNVTVNQASSTTTISSSLNPSTYGQGVTFTASVQAPQGINPFGTVTFMDGSATLGSASLSNGSAQFTLPGLAAGSHSITAVYAGDTYLTGSTSPSLAQSVSSASSATMVSSSVNPAIFGQTVVLSAAIQPGYGGSTTGTVTFLDGTVALGSSPVSGNAAQLSLSSLAVGSHAITAKYNGDTNVAGSTSAGLTQTVSQAATTTNVTSGANPAVFGQSVAFSVTIQPSTSGTPTGTVTLMDGSSSLGSAALPVNGVAQFTISSLAPGAHTISSSYSGDANYAGSTSSILTETVNQITTATTLASNVNPVLAGQAVTFTATVQAGTGNSASGTITFFDGSTSLGTATVSNNSAQFSTSNLAPGSHSVTAVYGGNADFTGSTSAALTETVNQITTTTTLASSVNPALAGQSVTFTATVQAGAGNSASGTVNFMDGSTSLGTATLASNSAQRTVSTLAAGSHSITAIYSGSTNFAGSTSAALTETVNQSSTTTTLVSNLNPATFGQAVPFVATVQTASGGAATGSVTFYDGSSQMGIATVSNNGGHNVAQFTFTGLLGGTHTITAAYTGDANYTASTSSALTETVTPASSSLSVGASANPASFGQAVVLTATVVPSISGDQASGAVTFFDGSSSLGVANLSNNAAQISVANLTLGPHSITASYAGDRNFAGSTSAALSEVVNPAATSTVVTSNANPTVVKTSVTFTATVSSPSAGTQSGTVNFYLDGSSTAVASVNLSNGTAKYSTNSLTAGSHSVVAVFTSSNPDFAGNTSPTFTQFVSDFTVDVTPTSLTVARGTSGTYTLTVTPVGDFSGIVSLSCGGVPGGTTCSISPTQVTLNGASPAQATVTITAAQNGSKGTHTLTFTGTSGGLNHKITANLIID